MIAPFAHERAGSLEDALRAVGEGAVPYAGGTELVAAMKLGFVSPVRLVDLKRVAGLRGLSANPGSVRVGATTPHAFVVGDKVIQRRLPMLGSVASEIGNTRVRWQGTVGGNLCFAEPRSDLIPALIALGARLHLRATSSERSVALEEFISEPFVADLRPGELLTEVEIPTADLTFQHYERLQLMERPTVGVALVGRGSGWRLCVGAAGYLAVWRDVASPRELDPDELAAAIEPIEDAAGAADYKRHLVGVLVARVLSMGREESGRGST